MVPISLRERVMNNLRQQRTVTSVELLTELLEASVERRVTSRSDVKKFMIDRGVIVHSNWARTTSTHLTEVWDFVKPTTPETSLVVVPDAKTALVPVACEAPPAVDTPPPPPPKSMLTLTTAMRRCWFEGGELPLVAPLAADPPPAFDRNDLYHTNEHALHELVEEGVKARTFDNMLMFVRLTTGERRELREYITWCHRSELTTFATKVNHGHVRCNDKVSAVINGGGRFTLKPVCDEVGFLNMAELDNVLYLLEGYLDGYGTRHPAGLNPTEVPHLVHRSLNQMGGNLAALKMYAKWDEHVKRTKGHVTKVNLLVAEARKALAACEEWEARGTDRTLTEAFCVKWETKCEEATTALGRAENECTTARMMRHELGDKIVDALADAYVSSPFTTPTRLLNLRATLKSSEPDHVATARDNVSEIRRILEKRPTSVRKALIELDLWNGRGRLPSFTRQEVNSSFRQIARRIHPDKNPDRIMSETPELLEKYQVARDCLQTYLEGICQG